MHVTINVQQYDGILFEWQWAPMRACRNCLNRRYFTSTGRDIGYSFQLAITAPLY